MHFRETYGDASSDIILTIYTPTSFHSSDLKTLKLFNSPNSTNLSTHKLSKLIHHNSKVLPSTSNRSKNSTSNSHPVGGRCHLPIVPQKPHRYMMHPKYLRWHLKSRHPRPKHPMNFEEARLAYRCCLYIKTMLSSTCGTER